MGNIDLIYLKPKSILVMTNNIKIEYQYVLFLPYMIPVFKVIFHRYLFNTHYKTESFLPIFEVFGKALSINKELTFPTFVQMDILCPHVHVTLSHS